MDFAFPADVQKTIAGPIATADTRPGKTSCVMPYGPSPRKRTCSQCEKPSPMSKRVIPAFRSTNVSTRFADGCPG